MVMAPFFSCQAFVQFSTCRIVTYIFIRATRHGDDWGQ
jgi:hypothetical protein